MEFLLIVYSICSKPNSMAACLKSEKILNMKPNQNNYKKRLVIIGGGFAGLNVAKRIDKNLWDVTLVDRNNYHSFPPLFYQVASSGLEPASITFPLRREFTRRSYRGCSFRLGKVMGIDAGKHTVSTKNETIPYDTLVIAAGTTNNFFGIPDLQKHVFTLKSTMEAVRCRNEFLDRLERAAICTDETRRRRLLTFVVIGGGPTGVEIAGALGEMKRYVIKREYPEIDPDSVRVVLVEGSDRLLRTMSEKSSADALVDLGKLMVEVQLQKTMTAYTDGRATFADGSYIDTDTLIWTAGITGVPFQITGAPVEQGRGGRFVVDEYNAVQGVDDIYAIGDIALMETPAYPHGHPQLAQVAIQQGQLLARNLNAKEPRKQFVYRDKGSMATIGRNKAVVDMGKAHLNGWIAWLAWMFVHLLTLLGMRNKTVVLVNWIWGYFTFSTSLRLLFRPARYPLRHYWEAES